MLVPIVVKERTEPGEVMHFYRDIDQIRLVYEEVATGDLQIVGWYRP